MSCGPGPSSGSGQASAAPLLSASEPTQPNLAFVCYASGKVPCVRLPNPSYFDVSGILFPERTELSLYNQRRDLQVRTSLGFIEPPARKSPIARMLYQTLLNRIRMNVVHHRIQLLLAPDRQVARLFLRHSVLCLAVGVLRHYDRASAHTPKGTRHIP